MTKEDIIRMARETLKEDSGEDYYAYTHQIPHWWGEEDEIVKFANLVAAAEREACAVTAFNAKTYLEAAAAIRARGEE